MHRSLFLLPLLLSACATTADFTSAARRKAALDWGCDRSEVTTQDLAENEQSHTVKATGCGKEETYEVTCKRDVGEAICSAEPTSKSIEASSPTAP